MEGQTEYLAALTQAAQAQHKMSQEEQNAARVRQASIEGINALSNAYSAQAARMTQHAMAAGAISTGLLGVAGAAVKAAADMEQAHIALNTLTGSAAAGDRLFAQLRQFAKETPFEFKDLPPLASKAMAYGFKPEEVVSTLRTVGDAAAAVGIGTEGMQRIITSLGQMQARGKVTGEEMQELASAGIPAAKYLAEAFGVTTAEIGKMQEKGIDASKAIPALLAGMNASFGGAMINQMQSATGKLSNFKDAVNELAVSAGNALLPAMKEMVTTGTALVSALSGAPESTKAVAAIGTVVVGVSAGIYAVVAAGKAWTYQTQVNIMQQALLTAELERQGIVLGANAGRMGLARSAMGIAGGAMAGGMLGMMTGGATANLGVGAGSAAWAGEVLGGAALGGAMGQAPGALVGALTALAAAAWKATEALEDMTNKAGKGQIGEEEEYKLAVVKGIGQVPMANIPKTGQEAELRGWWKEGPLTRDELIWGRDKDSKQQKWLAWRAENVLAVPESRTRKEAASGLAAKEAAKWAASPEGQAARLDALAKSYAGLTGQEDAYVQALDEAIAKHEELAAAVDTDTKYKSEQEKQLAKNTQAQAIANLETAKAEVGARAAAAAEAERTEILGRLSRAFADVSSGAGAYTGLLKTLGVDAMDPLMQRALAYTSNIGMAQAYNAPEGSAEYYGGLNMAASAQKEMLGEAGRGVMGVPGWKAGAIKAPWQTAYGQAAQKNYTAYVQATIWVEMPGGWERGIDRGSRAYAMLGAGNG